eukprot:9975934-Alexandrium_andersonii.AAC.1
MRLEIASLCEPQLDNFGSRRQGTPTHNDTADDDNTNMRNSSNNIASASPRASASARSDGASPRAKRPNN